MYCKRDKISIDLPDVQHVLTCGPTWKLQQARSKASLYSLHAKACKFGQEKKQKKQKKKMKKQQKKEEVKEKEKEGKKKKKKKERNKKH